MFNSKISTLILFVVYSVGFIAGWAFKPGRIIENSPHIADVSVLQSDANQVEAAEQVGKFSNRERSDELPNQADNAPDLFQENVRARSRRAMVYLQTLEQKIADDPLNPELEQELGRLLDSYFESGGPFGEIPALVYMGEKHPLLLQRALEYLTADLSNPYAPKKYLRFVDGLGINDVYRNAERFMLAKVEAGEPIDKWFAWAASSESFRLQLPETGRYMLDVLPSLTDAKKIDIAVRTITSLEEHGDRHLSRDEKKQFERILTPLFDSDDANLRARAIGTLGQVRRSDSKQLLLKGLLDPAKIVREQSYFHLLSNKIHDRALASVLMGNIEDSSLKMGERQLALMSLESGNRIPDLDEKVRQLRQQLGAQQK